MSWFYIFLRPAGIDFCADVVNKELYFWDYDYYILGVLTSVLMLLMFQVGASIPLKNYRQILSCYNVDRLALIKNLKKILYFSLLIFSLMLFLLILFYGQSLLPWERVGLGATSAALSGFEFIWPLVRILLFFIIVSSLFLFFETGKFKYFLYFMLIVLSILILGRRGILIAPILFFLFVYTFYRLSIRKDSLFVFFQWRYISVGLLVLIIAFLGKRLIHQVYLGDFSALETTDSGFICNIIKNGGQEFDLLWPAIIENVVKNYSLLDFVYAIVGNFYSHEDKLLNHEYLYSITDKLMMEYMKDVYVNLKFGISPNIYQFYISYLGPFAILALFLFGYVFRRVEKTILKAFFTNKFFVTYIVYLLMSFFRGPIDYTFKYFLAQTVYFLAVVVIYYLYSSLFRFKAHDGIK